MPRYLVVGYHKVLFLTLFFLVGNVAYGASFRTNRGLIIGISKYYSESLNLKYADNDAVLFYNYLISSDINNIKPENITLLLNEEATLYRINSELDKLLRESKKNDNITIYFSGHGDVIPNKDGTREQGFLLTHHASIDREHEAGGALSFSTLQSVTDSLIKKGAQVTIITDACRSGSSLNEDGALKTLSAFIQNFNNTTKIVSSRANEFSFEFENLEHGVFTYYLIKGMLGYADQQPYDDEITFDELNDFLREEVDNYTQNKISKHQHPRLQTSEEDKIYIYVDSVLRQRSEKFEKMMLVLNNKRNEGFFQYSLKNELEKLENDLKPAIQNIQDSIDKGYFIINDENIYNSIEKLDNKTYGETIKIILRNNLINSIAVSQQKIIFDHLNQKEKLLTNSDYRKGLQNSALLFKLIDSSNLNFNQFDLQYHFFSAATIIYGGKFNQYEHAEKHLFQALKNFPKAAFLHHLLGALYEEWDKTEKAIYHLDLAQEYNPEWASIYNLKGHVYRTSGDFEKALYWYSKILEKNPESDWAHNNIAILYYDMGQFQLAENYYNKALTFKLKSQDSVTTICNLGILYADRGLIIKAIDYFKKSIELNSDVYLGYYNLGNQKNLSFNERENNLQEARKLAPNQSKILVGIGSLYYYSGSQIVDTDKGKKYFSEAISLDPYYPYAYTNLAHAFMNEKKFDSALMILDQSQEFIPKHPVILMKYGEIQEKIGDQDKAEHFYLEAIELWKYNHWINEELASFYEFSKKDILKAEKTWKELLERSPKSPKAQRGIADFYLRNKQLDLAELHYLKTIQIDSNYSFGYISLSYLYVQKGELIKAKQFYDQTVKLDSSLFKYDEFISLVRLKANELVEKGDLSAAKNGFMLLHKIQPENAVIVYNLALLSYKLGQIDDADKFLQIHRTIVQSKEESGKILELHVLVALDKKNTDLAFLLIDKVHSSDPLPSYLTSSIAYWLSGDRTKALEFYGKEKAENPELLSELSLQSTFSMSTLKTIHKISNSYEK